MCGIITLTQDNRELAENEFDIFSRFYYLSAGAGVSQNFSFLVTKESKKVESLPDNFLSYGKTQELKLNYSGATTPENLKNLNPNVDDEVLSLCIPAVHYNNTNTDDVFYSSTEDETKKIYSSFSNTYEYNNTYNFNHIYSENTVSAVVEGLNDEELTSYTLESNAALDEKIKEAISGNTFTFRFSVDYQDQYSINISWSNLKNLRYLRCNVTETLDYIAENMTWTTTGSYSCGIFVLATFNSGMQFWFPLTASSSHYLDIQLWDISRCITMKKSIPVK